MALLLAIVPRLTSLALALRDDMDADSWRAFIALGVVQVALLTVGVASLIVQVVRQRGWRGWTRITLDEQGMTVNDDRRRVRIPWNGMCVSFSEHGNATVRGASGERAILDGWWMREGEGTHEALRLLQTALGELLWARRSPSRVRALLGVIVTLVIGIGLAIPWMSAYERLFERLGASDVEWRGLLPLAEGTSVSAGQLVRKAPRSSMAQAALAWALLGDHRAAEALAVADAAMELGEPRFVLGARSRALEALGRPREAARDAAGLIPWQGHVAAMEASRLLSLAGDTDAARRMAQRAVAMRDVPGTRARLREAESL